MDPPKNTVANSTDTTASIAIQCPGRSRLVSGGRGIGWSPRPESTAAPGVWLVTS